jgi:hypothetical protein
VCAWRQRGKVAIEENEEERDVMVCLLSRKKIQYRQVIKCEEDYQRMECGGEQKKRMAIRAKV